MGEGYHNYHHEFEWDYRNGVKPWQLDPSKWIIWTLSKFGLAYDLRRVPREKILLAETRETERKLNDQISLFQDSIAESANELMEQALSSSKMRAKDSEKFATNCKPPPRKESNSPKRRSMS